MYNRVGRILCVVVGRQLRQKLCENNNAATITCAAAISAVYCKPNNHIFHRNYCDKDTEEFTEGSNLQLNNLDEEGATKLKEFLETPENVRMYKIIEMEIEIMRQNSERVPVNLRPRHWAELVQYDSRNKRKRYLSFLWGLEKKKENVQKTKEEKRKLREEKSGTDDEERSIYRLGQNTMFLRFYDGTINHMYHKRLMNSMLYGQQLVLDCGYESHMTRTETKNCAKQLQLTFAANRLHDDPFDLYLCNANRSGELMKTLHRSIPPLYDPDFPLNIKSESYLDIYDKNQLVYLTPHCHNEMTEFHHDAVYIIGAFVDKSTNEPLSMAKAKKEGLKMMKLPLDRYLQWGSSSGKNLTLNQVLNILLDVKLTGCWETALKHVPRRKLVGSRLAALERRRQYLRRVEYSNDEKNNEKSNEKDDEKNDYNKSILLQELKPKTGLRYNASREFNPNSGRDFRSSYNRESRSNSGRDLKANIDQDFSMQSRAKFRNWKN